MTNRRNWETHWKLATHVGSAWLLSYWANSWYFFFGMVLLLEFVAIQLEDLGEKLTDEEEH